MADVVSSAVRIRMMSGASGKTKPEILARKALQAQGYRFRLHRKDLPGKLDIVLPRFSRVILVRGCFWHIHKGCRLARISSTRSEFWPTKLHSTSLESETYLRSATLNGMMLIVCWQVQQIFGRYKIECKTQV